MRAMRICFILLIFVAIIACDKGTDSNDRNHRVQNLARVYGTINDYYDNSPIPGAEVSISGSDQQITLTDANGYYVFERGMAPGACTLSVTLLGYAVTKTSLYIPDSEEIRGDINEGPTVGIDQFEEVDLSIYPLTGQLSGEIPAAAFEVPDFPGVPPHEPDVVICVHFEGERHLGVPGVWLDPAVYQIYPDHEGHFRFAGLPLADSARLATNPFQKGDSIVLGTSQTVPVMMLPQDSLISVTPEVVATECPEPTVTAFSLSEANCADHDAEFSITFSDSMYTSAGFEVTLAPDGALEEPTTLSWNDARTAVTITPTLGMLTDHAYILEIAGTNWCGSAIAGSYNITTCDGIALDSVITEPWSDDITLATLGFNRPPLLEHDSAYVRLHEQTTDRYLRSDVSVDGSDIMISPRTEIDPWMSLWVEYRVYSDIPRDSDSGSIQISVGM